MKSAGLAWIFSFPIFGGLFFGLRIALVALILNFSALFGFGLMMNLTSWSPMRSLSTGQWAIMSANMLFLNAVAAISVAVLVRGLEFSLRKEQSALKELSMERSQLRESERKYRLVVEHANEAIFIAQDGLIKFPNPSAPRITGYTYEQLGRTPFIALIHPEDRSMVTERHARRLRGEIVPDNYAFRVLSSSGDVRWVTINAVATTWEGKPATLNFIRDITDQKQLESQLLQARKMEAVGSLAGGIAHDFNNILAAMMGYAELAFQDVSPDSRARNGLTELLKAGERATSLVRQLLTFGRRTEYERKPIRIGELVQEALELVGALIPSTIRIKEELDLDAGIVEADPTQIHQVIVNLCTNAAHSMKEDGGILTVAVRNASGLRDKGAGPLAVQPGDYAEVMVEDTGKGMPPEVMERIFEPYYSTKSGGEGSGLGLAVVHGVVKSHGGGIEISSEVGKGTRVNVYFPLSRQVEEVQTESNLELPPPRGGAERVLYVDDEPAIADVGKQMLERLGYHVTAKTHSGDALRTFVSAPADFDLVITDITMPGLTGEKLAEEIMRVRPDIPVILCTGYSERVSEEFAERLGVRRLMMKPFTIKDLGLVIGEVLGKDVPGRKDNRVKMPPRKE